MGNPGSYSNSKQLSGYLCCFHTQKKGHPVELVKKLKNAINNFSAGSSLVSFC
jgi:hypothetical protein